jgi:transcriptional regulator with XRE-family HTH domain
MTDRTNAFDLEAAQRRKALGHAIRQARKPMNQTELGRKVGRPQASISMWENGQVALQIEQVFRLEAALGLEPGSLLRDAGYVNGEAWGD